MRSRSIDNKNILKRSTVSECNVISLYLQTRRTILSEHHPMGSNSTVPASISTKRRSISEDHAASISSSLLRASLALRTDTVAVSFGGWSALHGSVVRGVSDVLESCSRMDVLAQLTSVLSVRHRVAQIRCGKFVHGRGFNNPGISQNSRKNEERDTPIKLRT